MKKTAARCALLCMGFVLLNPVLSGCRTKAQVSPEEQANWKGGPMPADFQKDLEAQTRRQAGKQPPR